MLERMVNDGTRTNNKGKLTFDPDCYYGTKKQLWVARITCMRSPGHIPSPSRPRMVASTCVKINNLI